MSSEEKFRLSAPLLGTPVVYLVQAILFVCKINNFHSANNATGANYTILESICTLDPDQISEVSLKISNTSFKNFVIKFNFVEEVMSPTKDFQELLIGDNKLDSKVNFNKTIRPSLIFCLF